MDAKQLAEDISAGKVRVSVLEDLVDALSVERCRVCGCTEVKPCEPPCGWADYGLCTACVRER